ncbi:hypothetical protein QBC43DRAFT_306850 [Cladorrhinum sp. PSN259]|nr:hypothetical protein QBC43DRAFT_306850 [Cladorrhinum sp. PSN259]
MAATKTYYLAPNFSYHPDTSIKLGDIVQDPSDPTIPLGSVQSLPPKETHLDLNASFSNTTSKSVNAGIWAKFVEIASASLGGSTFKTTTNTYTMDRLETVYFRTQPSPELISETVKSSTRIQAAMSSGLSSFGTSKPVYLVSGLKIARGFRVESGIGHTRGGQVSIEASETITGGVGVGMEVGKESSWESRQEFSAAEGQDIVFAYQLHVIKRRKAEAKVYKGKGAFLSEDGQVQQDEEVEVVEIGEAGVESIMEFDDEMEIETVDLGLEGEEGVQVVVLGLN